MARRLGGGERFRIEVLVGLGHSAAGVARRLGRSRSAVWREVARNGGRCGYRAEAAQQAATVRARRPRASKLICDPGLALAVAEGLSQRWSPHAIATGLRDAGAVVTGHRWGQAVGQAQVTSIEQGRWDARERRVALVLGWASSNRTGRLAPVCRGVGSIRFVRVAAGNAQRDPVKGSVMSLAKNRR